MFEVTALHGSVRGKYSLEQLTETVGLVGLIEVAQPRSRGGSTPPKR